MIEVKELTKRYGNNRAVKELSFSAEQGQIYGFLGPNGAGKTTTMNMMTGYIAPSSGQVLINGHDIVEDGLKARRCIGYLPEIPPVYPEMTTEEYLLFSAGLKGIPLKLQGSETERVMDLTGTEEVKKRLIRNLSKGFRQRVGLAQALIGDPEMAGGNSYVIMSAAQGLTQSEDSSESLRLTEVLSTTSDSYIKTDVQHMKTYEKESGDIDGPFAIGMLAQEEVQLTDQLLNEANEVLEGNETALSGRSDISPEPDAENETEAVAFADETEAGEGSSEAETEPERAGTATTRLAVYTSSSLLDSSANQMVSGGNQKLFIQTLSWMCGHTQSVSIPVKSMDTSYLTLTAASANFWSVLVVGIVPAAILFYGFYVWMKRRKL